MKLEWKKQKLASVTEAICSETKWSRSGRDFPTKTVNNGDERVVNGGGY